jgi:hypothetical protein
MCKRHRQVRDFQTVAQYGTGIEYWMDFPGREAKLETLLWSLPKEHWDTNLRAKTRGLAVDENLLMKCMLW